MPSEEARKIRLGDGPRSDFYKKALERSRRLRDEYGKRTTIVHAAEMPWEESAQGWLKHLVHEDLFTKEFSLEMYMQYLEPGKASGKHRHMAEEVFYVLEGRGYDVHWDVKPEIGARYVWKWEAEPKRFEWEEGDFVYIPPLTIHQHFNAGGPSPARFITATNRLVRLLGLDWMDQIEEAGR